MSSLKLKYPVVLIHGLGAKSGYGFYDHFVHYFYGLPELLRDSGCQVFIAELTAFQTIENRAKQLKEQIECCLPLKKAGKVNLVGHSIGGLDARHMVSQLGFADKAASVTSIGTPHRGTILSDIAERALPDFVFSATDKLLYRWESSFTGFKQITRQYMQDVFNNENPNQPGVAYFSATSAIPSPAMAHSLPLFWVTHKIVKKYEGENDGFISIDSAKWGEHICTYPGDHYAQIGQFVGRSRGMNYIEFYKEIFGRLKKEGF